MARPSGLGKGLGELGNLVPLGTTGADIASPLQEIDISHIVPNRNQPRSHFDEEMLGSLADSIKSIGVIQPIVVRQIAQGYEIIAGERRWRAAQRAGLTIMPALVRQSEDQESLEVAVVENLHRQDLNPLEEAAAYRQLMDDFGMNQGDVAQKVGRSRSAIANTIRLLNLPARVQRLMIEGQLSAGHGRALLAVEGDDVRDELADMVVQEGLSVRETETRIADYQEGEFTPSSGGEKEKTEPSPESQAAILELEELFAKRFDTKVSVKLSRKAGRLTIHFADVADLERIYKALN